MRTFLKKKSVVFLTLLTGMLTASLLSPQAQALPLAEKWIIDRSPTPSEITAWTQRPTQDSFVWNSGDRDPQTGDLQAWLPIAQKHALSIQLRKIPGEDTSAIWRQLALLDVEPVFWNVSSPTESEITRLNSIGFRNVIWVTEGYPAGSEGLRFRQWKTHLTFTFATGKFPRYLDRDALTALPETGRLLFVATFWPWSTQLDLLNLLPQAKRLRILEIYPSADHWQYLDAIKNLEEIQLTNRYAPPDGAATWLRFGVTPLRWTLSDWIPTQAQLLDFANSQSNPSKTRKLVVDQDFPLSADQRQMLEALPCPAEWIHKAY